LSKYCIQRPTEAESGYDKIMDTQEARWSLIDLTR
jgi:hypothetical protein